MLQEVLAIVHETLQQQPCTQRDACYKAIRAAVAKKYDANSKQKN